MKEQPVWEMESRSAYHGLCIATALIGKHETGAPSTEQQLLKKLEQELRSALLVIPETYKGDSKKRILNEIHKVKRNLVAFQNLQGKAELLDNRFEPLNLNLARLATPANSQIFVRRRGRWYTWLSESQARTGMRADK